MNECWYSFQLYIEPFNSLSRDHRGEKSYINADVTLLSTPSLGITWNGWEVDETGFASFLSTPSLGITEPDSGIFRLSAAFCRGTPSHK